MEMFREKVSHLAHFVCLVVKVEMSALQELQLFLSSEQTVRLACLIRESRILRMDDESGRRNASRVRHRIKRLPRFVRHDCESVAPCGHAAATALIQVVVEVLADVESSLVRIMVCADTFDLAGGVVELARSSCFGETLSGELRS